MKFDLHIHSCLSPCASLEMSPGEIVARAKAAGMGGIAITDHNSAMNAPAMAARAKRAGLACLFGLEIQTAEETHTLALFDTVDQALAMTDWVYAAMPKRVNDPDTFGDQPILSAEGDEDEIADLEWRILAMGCRRTIPDTAAKTHELGGLYIAAHIDRPNYSVVAALGSVPFAPDGSPYFDAVEFSRTAEEEQWLDAAEGYAITRSSDAHNLDDVARVWTEADIGNFTVAELKRAFAFRLTRPSPRLTRF
ncbi:MAG: PHP domain-containing protein [Kiritimatiellae bacterium]|nr:PHP domain-containing protein [Kiritimatiellia bacterium]